MSRSYAPQSSQTASLGSQDQERASAGSAGAGNAAAMAKLDGEGPVRDRNLPFRFNPSALARLGRGALGQSLQNQLTTTKQTGNKDGTELTDPEKLYTVVRTLVAQGASQAELCTTITGLFFDQGDQARGRDTVSKVIFSGGEVRIEFSSPGGYGFNQGAIIPMICTAPVTYDGMDTNARGSLVQNFQDNAVLPRAGSFLERQATVISDGFLRTPAGKPFAGLDASARATDSAFRKALYEYEKDVALDYLVKGREYVKQALGPVDGRSPQELLTAAVSFAQGFKNPYVYAVPHTTLETQDEALAQAALAELGITANVDTDDIAASTATRR